MTNVKMKQEVIVLTVRCFGKNTFTLQANLCQNFNTILTLNYDLWRIYTRPTGCLRLPAEGYWRHGRHRQTTVHRIGSKESVATSTTVRVHQSACVRQGGQVVWSPPNCEDFVGIGIMGDFNILLFINQ